MSRSPWTEERESFLREWWPHFGTYWVADQLLLTRRQVKTKVDKIGLKMLPKVERLCVLCRERRQESRRAGLACGPCCRARRKDLRRARPPKLRQWIAEFVRTARHRSPVPSDLTADFMVDLWHKQKGRCFYSGRPMRAPAYGKGRDSFSPSIDRVDPKRGYLRDNVVWASWVCNAGKSVLSAYAYVDLCADVVARSQAGESVPAAQRRLFGGRA